MLRLLDGLRRELGLAVVVISHDLDSLAGVADRIAVLYRGQVVEQGPAEAVLTAPLHPYSALLVASAPSLDRTHRTDLALLRGPAAAPPAASDCAFAHRCPFADADCAARPAPTAHGPGRSAACHHAPDWRARLSR
ncbi:hypothetical protein GCM10025734_13530 [Kitasatospora paranensis]|uniref:oligopeptide/dipeptide ABC transporter ATP-binding protein n=1 Tax=Kitasatospora paranensis TaxID=258053 RepID=UPI0031EA01D2